MFPTDIVTSATVPDGEPREKGTALISGNYIHS